MRPLSELVEILRGPSCTDPDCRTERYRVANELVARARAEKELEATMAAAARATLAADELVEATIVCGEMMWKVGTSEYVECDQPNGHPGPHAGAWRWLG